MAASLVDIDQLRVQIREIEAGGSIGGTPNPSIDEETRDAFKKILKLASIKERASEQVRARLIQDGFSEKAVLGALERAIACRIIDDERYAESFVRMRVAQGKGRRGIERELENLALSVPADEVWEEACANTGMDEFERALRLLNRKPPRSRNLREGAYRKLVQNGFSSDIASSAARHWVEARSND